MGFKRREKAPEVRLGSVISPLILQQCSQQEQQDHRSHLLAAAPQKRCFPQALLLSSCAHSTPESCSPPRAPAAVGASTQSIFAASNCHQPLSMCFDVRRPLAEICPRDLHCSKEWVCRIHTGNNTKAATALQGSLRSVYEELSLTTDDKRQGYFFRCASRVGWSSRKILCWTNTEGHRNSQHMTVDSGSGYFAGLKLDKACLLLRFCEHRQNQIPHLILGAHHWLIIY